jgi:hypothetical protein
MVLHRPSEPAASIGTYSVVLAAGCLFGQIVHEIGHTVGLFHEHTRPDRDQYVQILWDNILPEAQSDFQIDPLAVATGPL